MKAYRIITVVSVAANFIFLFMLYKSTNRSKEVNTSISSVSKDLSIHHNFEKIFLEKNDSIYRMVYGKSFEELPVQAYLLACTYYLVKKDSSSKKDIQMISSEIKAIYGKSPEIIFPK